VKADPLDAADTEEREAIAQRYRASCFDPFRQSLLVAPELFETLVADPEMVGDFVQHHPPDLAP
jgi:hypothetical protein